MQQRLFKRCTLLLISSEFLHQIRFPNTRLYVDYSPKSNRNNSLLLLHPEKNEFRDNQAQMYEMTGF